MMNHIASFSYHSNAYKTFHHICLTVQWVQVERMVSVMQSAITKSMDCGYLSMVQEHGVLFHIVAYVPALLNAIYKKRLLSYLL